MILVDFSNLYFINAMSSAAINETAIRHLVLNSLRGIIKKHGDAHDNKIVLCSDHKDTWRKREFPAYKWRRRHQEVDDRMQTVLDLKTPFEKEIAETFQGWTFLKVAGAEGDDIITTLAMCTGDPVMIVSNDSDYNQLCKFPHVRQYDPLNNKIIPIKKSDLPRNLFEGILTGQAGKDDIPNIRNPSDFFVTKKDGQRQKSVTKKFKEQAWEAFQKGNLETFLDKDEYERYLENERLIDVTKVPDEILRKVLAEFMVYPVGTNSQRDVMGYMSKQRLRVLVENISDFI